MGRNPTDYERNESSNLNILIGNESNMFKNMFNGNESNRRRLSDMTKSQRKRNKKKKKKKIKKKRSLVSQQT
jgi:hypothetical protein